MTNPASPAPSSPPPPSTPLTPWEAREILGSGPESGRPSYLHHHPDCTPPSDCVCNLFGIQNRLREIAESATPSSPEPLTPHQLGIRGSTSLDVETARHEAATETPAELQEALDELDKARGLACKVTHDGRWDAAKAALISIYNRQREESAEIIYWLEHNYRRMSHNNATAEEANRLGRLELTELSSQLVEKDHRIRDLERDHAD